MKKNIFPIILMLLLASSCGKDFLNEKPLNTLTEANFFQTESDAIQATNAIYNMLRRWEVHVFSYIGMTDIASDDSDKGSTPTDGNFLLEVDDFTLSAGNLAPLTEWQGHYKGIYRANIAIEKIPTIKMDATLQKRLVAESKVLRAYFYYNLVVWFGDIPLINKTLTDDEYKQARKPAAEIYAQIEKDLKEAIVDLPEKSQYTADDLGRATKGAARGLLARAYLQKGDFANADKYALEVINSKEYALFPDYQKLFLKAGENSSESIFEVQTVADALNLGGSQYNEVQGVRGTPNLGWGFNRPSDDLVRAFESGDPRRDATILYVGEVLPDGSTTIEDNPEVLNERYNQKAWIPQNPAGNGNGGGNIRLIRYADILLIHAECANELGNTQESLTYLNQVRARARGTNTRILPDVTTTAKDDLRQKIWQERRVELAMEQRRWADLARQKRLGAVMQKVGKKFTIGKNELFPIPQQEIDLSGGTLSQNAGY